MTEYVRENILEYITIQIEIAIEYLWIFEICCCYIQF